MNRRQWSFVTCLLLLVPAPGWPDAAAAGRSRTDLVATFTAAFAQGDWTTASRAAHEILTLEEQARSASDPALVPALLNVASTESELGHTTEAQAYISRASVLLAAQAAPDPAQSFARDIVLAKADLRAGRYEDARRQCRLALKAVDGNPAVGIQQRSQAYALMLESARGEQDIPLGNGIAKEMLKAEQQALGRNSPARTPGIYDAASWYRLSSQLPRERDLLGEAMTLLEKAYGANDQRLAYPLWTIGMSYLVGHSAPEKSRAALERAVALAVGTSPRDVMERAQILASLGDHTVVFGDPAASGAEYAAAWKVVALDPQLGSVVADRMFGKPVSLYVRIPSEPFPGVKGGEHFSTGEVTFAFTVTELGLVDELRIKDKEMDRNSLPTPTVQAFRQARYRPRVQDGKPVATANQQFRMVFGIASRGGG